MLKSKDFSKISLFCVFSVLFSFCTSVREKVGNKDDVKSTFTKYVKFKGFSFTYLNQKGHLGYSDFFVEFGVNNLDSFLHFISTPGQYGNVTFEDGFVYNFQQPKMLDSLVYDLNTASCFCKYEYLVQDSERNLFLGIKFHESLIGWVEPGVIILDEQPDNTKYYVLGKFQYRDKEYNIAVGSANKHISKLHIH